MSVHGRGRSGAGLRTTGRRVVAGVDFAGRYLTADLRTLPDFVILGEARCGTTSLLSWLNSHPDVAPAYQFQKEVHFFDRDYNRGLRWYRAHFPTRFNGRITGESSPHMLLNPLSPARAANDLPSTTRFIALLRDPVERAVSHYWHNRRMRRWETESFQRAIELEPDRLASTYDSVLRGEWSVDHMALSYMARGEYAPHLRRWFEAVGRDRVLVVESEQLYSDKSASQQVLEWLGLPPHDLPFPKLYGAARHAEEDSDFMAQLAAQFEPRNHELFDLLGHELWTTPRSGSPDD